MDPSNEPAPFPLAERSEVLVPGPANALAGLLGVPAPDLDTAALPMLWHSVYLLDRPAQADLGVDGHPVSGAIPTPAGPGRRRMFAGGRVHTINTLRCGLTATRRSRIGSSTDKRGRSGDLTFVTVVHEIWQSGELAIVEEQDIVYRYAQDPAPPRTGREAADTSSRPAVSDRSAATAVSAAGLDDIDPGSRRWTITIDPVLLFRFSALTYNAHRIHYDRDYARGTEGYPGLLVHGPLQAILMAEALRRRGLAPEQTTFGYRLVAPLFDHQGLVVAADTTSRRARTTVADRDGRTTASGELTQLVKLSTEASSRYKSDQRRP